MAIQCSLPRARPTTLPARWVVGRTVNAVGARTNAKKMSPPIQTTRDNSMRKRRKDMRRELYLDSDRGSAAASDHCRLTTALSQWHNHVLDNLAQHLIGLLGFFQGRSIASVDDHTVGEDRNGERLEVFWSAEAAAVEEGHGLRRAVKRLRSARRNT